MTTGRQGSATAVRAGGEEPLPALPGLAGSPLLASVASLAGFLLLLVVVTTTRGTDAADLAVLRGVAAVRSPGPTSVALDVTALGSPTALVVVTLLASALLGYRTRSLRSPLVLLTSVALSAATVYLLKVAVGRAAPSVTVLLGNRPLEGSFPSGHTTNSAVGYVLGAALLARTLRTPRTGRLLVAGAVLLALVIGVTRVYLGYHWCTDVLAGWLLASAVVLGATTVTRVVTPGYGPVVLARRRPRA